MKAMQMDRFTKEKKSRGHKTRMTIIKQNRLNYFFNDQSDQI